MFPSSGKGRETSVKLHIEELRVRVLGYRSGGPGSIPGTTMKKK
jgi:hypothetical protein